MKCKAEPARGMTCEACGREHRYIFTVKRILVIGGLVVIGVVAIAVWQNSAAIDNWMYNRNAYRYKGNKNAGEEDWETGEIRPRKPVRHNGRYL
jgi:hypothetical protein